MWNNSTALDAEGKDTNEGPREATQKAGRTNRYVPPKLRVLETEQSARLEMPCPLDDDSEEELEGEALQTEMEWKVGKHGNQDPPPTKLDGLVRRGEPPAVKRPTTQTHTTAVDLTQADHLGGGRDSERKKTNPPPENRCNRQDLEEKGDDH